MNELYLEQIDYRYILVDNYKSLGLNENELAIILSIDNILKKDDILITAEILSLKMNLSNDIIDSLLVNLMQRGFIEYKTINNSLVTSLKPTYDKILTMFKNDLFKMVKNNLNNNINQEVDNLYLTIQKEIGRSLSPIELEKVRDWISQGIGQDVVVDCIHQCQQRLKRVTINQIDKAICKYLSSRDIEKEGYSSINEKWKKDVEETLKIANVKWTDIDE